MHFVLHQCLQGNTNQAGEVTWREQGLCVPTGEMPKRTDLNLGRI